MDKISVLIVDDSALMRNLVSRIVESAPNLSVAATAMNGQFALEKIPLCKPDIIVLDVEMPVMNGLQFLQERKNRGIDIPVIMLSSLTSNGAVITMQCLEMGACDFIQKPSGAISLDIHKVAETLTEKIISYGGRYASKKRGLSGSVLNTYMEPPEESPAKAPAPKPILDKPSATDDKAHEHMVPLSFKTPSWTVATKEKKEIVPIREPGMLEIIAIGI